MEPLIAGMRAREITERRRKLKFTVLHRPEGVWHPSETDRLINGCMTDAYQHPQHPEHLILFGHYTKARTLEILGGGQAYTAVEVTGLESDKLPFRPPDF